MLTVFRCHPPLFFQALERNKLLKSSDSQEKKVKVMMESKTFKISELLNFNGTHNYRAPLIVPDQSRNQFNIILCLSHQMDWDFWAVSLFWMNNSNPHLNICGRWSFSFWFGFFVVVFYFDKFHYFEYVFILIIGKL